MAPTNLKWALVTGASSGIGYEFAKVLAKDGLNVILVARRRDRLEKLKAEIEAEYKVQAEIVVADLSNPEEVERVHSASKRFTEHLDILINNAGFGKLGHFHELDQDRQLNMIDLNVRALTQLCHLYSRDMVKGKKGYICNVASTAAFQPGPLMAVYFATKSYVLSLSEALDNELREYGVVVSALCPGPTKSEFKVEAHMESTELMSRMNLPSSQEVAEFGYKSLMNKKTVAIHGLLNRALTFTSHFIPGSIVKKVTRRVIEKA